MGDTGTGQTGAREPRYWRLGHCQVYHRGTLRFPPRIPLRRLRLWKINVRTPVPGSPATARGAKPQYGGYSARSVPGEPSCPGQARVRAARYVHTMWTVLWTTSVVADQALATRRGEGSASVTDTDLTDVWARSLEGLAELHVQPSQLAWLKLTRPLGLVENTALIATPNAFVKEQLETRLRPLVTHALSRELGRPIQLAVTVDPSPGGPPEPPPAPLSSPLSPGAAAHLTELPPDQVQPPPGISPIGTLPADRVEHVDHANADY